MCDYNPELIIDVKDKDDLHKADCLSLLLYTSLLMMTVLTIWLCKHRRIRFLHETGLALLLGLIMGAIVHYGISGLGSGPMIIKVQPCKNDSGNNSRISLPNILLLEAFVKSNNTLINKTLEYDFRGEVKDIESINQVSISPTSHSKKFFK
jgi:sodium/hydrogen exchanger-like protein 6/7